MGLRSEKGERRARKERGEREQTYVLNTEAGSNFVMRRIANKVPEMEITAVITKNASFVHGENVNKVPALAIPFLNPSISA